VTRGWVLVTMAIKFQIPKKMSWPAERLPSSQQDLFFSVCSIQLVKRIDMSSSVTAPVPIRLLSRIGWEPTLSVHLNYLFQYERMVEERIEPISLCEQTFLNLRPLGSSKSSFITSTTVFRRHDEIVIQWEVINHSKLWHSSNIR
jgi:hypothetical protein